MDARAYIALAQKESGFRKVCVFDIRRPIPFESDVAHDETAHAREGTSDVHTDTHTKLGEHCGSGQRARFARVGGVGGSDLRPVERMERRSSLEVAIIVDCARTSIW